MLAAQIEAESGWNPNAVSPAGAQGIAQFMPSTWPSWAVDGNGNGTKSPFEPADAIPAQAKMMCSLHQQIVDKKLPGDPVDLTLAAYNAGIGRVIKYRGVPPYPETQAYIVRIRKLIAKYADPNSPAPGAGPAGTWRLPLAPPYTTGPGFNASGSRWGNTGGKHTGQDFSVPDGTPVYAANDGTVTAAGPVNSGYGVYVKIDHGGDVGSLYAHLSACKVQVGQHVSGGQLIATSGHAGNATGPHLHFEIRVNTKPVDPAAFYAAHGVDLTP